MEFDFYFQSSIELQNLTYMKKRESYIPFREINWKKYAYLHNRQNNIFYDCQCGKRYVSFPAIYLHFQRKHKKKLSNRQEPPECQIRKTDNQLAYFYFIPTKRQNSGNLCEKQTNIWTQINNLGVIRPLLTNFMNQEKQFITKSYNIKLFLELLTNLENFINLQEQKILEKNMNSQCQLLMNLPLYFNDFVLNDFKDGKICQQNYFEVCKILLHLSKWLNKKKISNLVVQLNMEQ